MLLWGFLGVAGEGISSPTKNQQELGIKNGNISHYWIVNYNKDSEIKSVVVFEQIELLNLFIR